MPRTPPSELTSTIRPPPWARICGSTAWTDRTQPQKFVSNWALASASAVCSTAPAIPHPAAATRASSRPWVSMIWLTPAVTAASSSTFMTVPCHPGPDVPRLLAPVTVQPAAASRAAQAWPIPADAPVTRTTFAGCAIWLPCSPASAGVRPRPTREVGAGPWRGCPLRARMVIR
jgi:hypothetical protein